MLSEQHCLRHSSLCSLNRGVLVACEELHAENTAEREAQAGPPQLMIWRGTNTAYRLDWVGLTERTGAEGPTIQVEGFIVLRNNKNHGSANGYLNGIFLVT